MKVQDTIHELREAITFPFNNGVHPSTFNAPVGITFPFIPEC
jgi:hypothetical protein